MEIVNWTWSLSLIALTVALHTTGIVMMALAEVTIRVRWLETRTLRLSQVTPIVIGMIAAVALLLTVLHGLEVAIWAAMYTWVGALDSSKGAILYSIDSMTTRGASGITMESHWLTMGALEAANGMLLFGISTAYIFAMIQAYWPILSKPLRDRLEPGRRAAPELSGSVGPDPAHSTLPDNFRPASHSNRDKTDIEHPQF